MTTPPKPSPEHAKYQALLPDFWRKVEQQEAEMIDRGLPARGMVDFAKTWFDGWRSQDVAKIRQCVTEDATYIDSSSFQTKIGGKGLTAEHCRIAFTAFPDLAFYPQDATNRSLPYADYFEGQWRLTIPWRGIGRFTGTMVLPQFPGVVIPGTGRCINFIGIDRYTLTDDFRITHIDTDWDMAFGLLQLVPFGVSAADAALRVLSRPAVFRTMGAMMRALVPALKLLNALSPTPARFRESTVERLMGSAGVDFHYPASVTPPLNGQPSVKARKPKAVG